MAAAFRGRPHGQGAGSVLVPPGSGSGSPAPDPAEVLGGVDGGEGGDGGGCTGGVAWADRDGVVPCGWRCRWARRCCFAGCRCRGMRRLRLRRFRRRDGSHCDRSRRRGHRVPEPACQTPGGRWLRSPAPPAPAPPTRRRPAAARCAAPAAAAAPGARRHRRRTARPTPPPRCRRRPGGPRYRNARARPGNRPATRTRLLRLGPSTPRAVGPVRPHPRRAGSPPACAARRAAPPGSD